MWHLVTKVSGVWLTPVWGVLGRIYPSPEVGICSYIGWFGCSRHQKRADLERAVLEHLELGNWWPAGSHCHNLPMCCDEKVTISQAISGQGEFFQPGESNGKCVEWWNDNVNLFQVNATHDDTFVMLILGSVVMLMWTQKLAKSPRYELTGYQFW